MKHPKFQWVSPGGVLAVLLWLVASAGFALYVASFGHYNKTYGSLGGVIVFLIWLWISNVVILLGAEFNAELERSAGTEPTAERKKEPFLEPRDTRKRTTRSGHEDSACQRALESGLEAGLLPFSVDDRFDADV